MEQIPVLFVQALATELQFFYPLIVRAPDCRGISKEHLLCKSSRVEQSWFVSWERSLRGLANFEAHHLKHHVSKSRQGYNHFPLSKSLTFVLDLNCDYCSPCCVWHTGKAHHSNGINRPRADAASGTSQHNFQSANQKCPGRVSTNVLEAYGAHSGKRRRPCPNVKSTAHPYQRTTLLDFSTIEKKPDFSFCFRTRPHL